MNQKTTEEHYGKCPFSLSCTHHLVTLSLFLSARREVFLQDGGKKLHWVLVLLLQLYRLPAGSISLMCTMRSIYTSLTILTPLTLSHRPRLADLFRAVHKAPIGSLCSLLYYSATCISPTRGKERISITFIHVLIIVTFKRIECTLILIDLLKIKRKFEAPHNTVMKFTPVIMD